MTQVPNLTMNDGRQIPQLGYGVFQVEPVETERLVRIAVEAGYRSIDTAQAYRNEEGVGAAIKDCGVDREDLFITTKLWNRNQPVDLAMPSFEESLRKLQLDYVDLFLIHWPQPMFDEYVDAWKVLEKLQADGRARSIGVSNFNIEHLQRLFEETGTVPVVNQVELHPGFSQSDLREFHAKHNILTEAWSPIGQGKGLLEDPLLVQIAESKGKTPAQVVIRWHIQLGNVVIPKSSTPHRIAENFDVFDFELTDDEVAQIDSVHCPRIGPDPNKMSVR